MSMVCCYGFCERWSGKASLELLRGSSDSCPSHGTGQNETTTLAFFIFLLLVLVFPQISQCWSSPCGFICYEQSLCLHTETADYRCSMKTSVPCGLMHTHICQLTGLVWWKNLTLFNNLNTDTSWVVTFNQSSDKKYYINFSNGDKILHYHNLCFRILFDWLWWEGRWISILYFRERSMGELNCTFLEFTSLPLNQRCWSWEQPRKG